MLRLYTIVCSFPVYWKNVRFSFSKHQVVFLKPMVIFRVRINLKYFVTIFFVQIGFKNFDGKFYYTIIIISIGIETF